jgi:hypothetical protein
VESNYRTPLHHVGWVDPGVDLDDARSRCHSQPRFDVPPLANRRLRALVELISIVQQRLARWPDGGSVRLSDGILLAVANYPGCAERSEFAGFARYGFAKSQHRYVYGVRLVLLTNARGLPLGYTIVSANEKEYEPLADLLTGTPAAVVVADKGFWGAGYEQPSGNRFV